MPEGHSVHRVARQFRTNFVGTRPEVSSPQGRFSAGANLLSGREMTAASAVGKQMFLEFEEQSVLRVHLGIYGAWDFAGDIVADPSLTRLVPVEGEKAFLSELGVLDSAAEDSLSSIGAPRKSRIRIAETTLDLKDPGEFPPPPVGQVRARILNDKVCADLRGPTACEVITIEESEQIIEKLGPDPARLNSDSERERFISRAMSKRSPIGLVLMDQSVIAGIGNVYRAELLFRSSLHPYTPANEFSREVFERLWDDWSHLLSIGIEVGQMITIDHLQGEDYDRALRNRNDRHWVYKRDGALCRRCGTHISLEVIGNRKLYWCTSCQDRKR